MFHVPHMYCQTSCSLMQHQREREISWSRSFHKTHMSRPKLNEYVQNTWRNLLPNFFRSKKWSAPFRKGHPQTVLPGLPQERGEVGIGEPGGRVKGVNGHNTLKPVPSSRHTVTQSLSAKLAWYV